jgi:hypothetical protein
MIPPSIPITAQCDHEGRVHMAPAACSESWSGGAFLSLPGALAAINAGALPHYCGGRG